MVLFVLVGDLCLISWLIEQLFVFRFVFGLGLLVLCFVDCCLGAVGCYVFKLLVGVDLHCFVFGWLVWF